MQGRRPVSEAGVVRLTGWRLLVIALAFLAIALVLATLLAAGLRAQEPLREVAAVEVPSKRVAPIKVPLWRFSRATVVLGAIEGGAALADGASTRYSVARGWSEADPIARGVCGGYPKWRCMGPAGTAEVAVAALAGEWLRRQKGPVRRLWWMPQVGLAAVHVWAAQGNYRRGWAAGWDAAAVRRAGHL